MGIRSRDPRFGCKLRRRWFLRVTRVQVRLTASRRRRCHTRRCHTRRCHTRRCHALGAMLERRMQHSRLRLAVKRAIRNDWSKTYATNCESLPVRLRLPLRLQFKLDLLIINRMIKLDPPRMQRNLPQPQVHRLFTEGNFRFIKRIAKNRMSAAGKL